MATPQLNFGPGKSGEGITNTQTSKIQGRGPTNLFSDEQEKYNQMTADGLDDTTARSLISKKRKSLLQDISSDEAKVLLQMQKDGLDSETSVQVLKEHRNKTMPLYKKALKIPFDMSVGASSLATEQVGNLLDFATGGQVPYFKEQVEGVKEVIGRSFEDSTAFKSGRGILGAGEMAAVGPTKISPTLLGRTAQGAVTMGAIGVAEPILEKGADVTPGEIVGGGLKGAAIGAAATPILEKAILPIISKTAQKIGKYGTASIKGGAEGLKKSVTRDIKGTKPQQFTKATTKQEKGRQFLYQAVNPTKQETKAVLKKRVDDLLPYIDTKKPLTNTLENVKGRIDIDKTKALNSMKNYERNVGVKGTLKTQPIIEKLESKFKKKVGGGYINKDEAKIADDLIENLKQFGDEIKDKDIISIRRAWDKIEKKNKGFMMSAEATSKGDIFGEANKFFREEIKLSNPEYAKYLEQYHKTTTIGDVLQATIDRRVGQQGGGFIRRGFETGTRIMGAGTGGLPGYLTSEALIQGAKLLSSPSIKLTRGASLLKKGNILKSNLGKYGVDNSRVGNIVNNSKGGKSYIKKPLALPVGKTENAPKTVTLPSKKPIILKEKVNKPVIGTTKPTTFKQKTGEKLDSLATKVGAKINIIEDRGTGMSGKKVLTPKSDLKPLIEEAKRYKSADEFVKAQGKPVYHGSKDKIYEFKSGFEGINEVNEVSRQGIFFTNDWKKAKTYGEGATQKIGGGKVTQGYLYPKKEFTIDYKGKSQLFENIAGMLKQAKERGYDLVTIKGWRDGVGGVQRVVLDPKIIKTKEQLIDIYKKTR